MRVISSEAWALGAGCLAFLIFFGAGFRVACFLAASFFATGFLATGRGAAAFAAGFFRMGVLEADFFAAGFFAATFLVLLFRNITPVVAGSLVVRFRHLHSPCSSVQANVGIKGPLAIY
ncbi:MAG TPA: hypothetical protein VIJ72_05165 [Rhizomicrobium sp.]